MIAKRSAVLPGEGVALCDLGLAQGHKLLLLPREEEEPTDHLKNCMLLVKTSLSQRRFAVLAPLSGSSSRQLSPRVFPYGPHSLDYVGGKDGLGICLRQRRAGSRK